MASARSTPSSTPPPSTAPPTRSPTSSTCATRAPLHAAVDGTTIYPTTIPNVSPAQCPAAVAAIQGQLGAFQRNVTQDIYFPRLDYQVTKSTHLSAEYLFENFHQPNGYNSSVTASNGGISNNGTADFHERIGIVNAETALSATAANVVHFQFSRDLETDTTNSGGPFNSLSNLVAFGETSALPRGKFPDEHKYQITDIYSKTFGRHSFKAGFDLNFIHEQIANLFGGDGSFTYTNASAEVNFANFVQDASASTPPPSWRRSRRRWVTPLQLLLANRRPAHRRRGRRLLEPERRLLRRGPVEGHARSSCSRSACAMTCSWCPARICPTRPAPSPSTPPRRSTLTCT